MHLALSKSMADKDFRAATDYKTHLDFRSANMKKRVHPSEIQCFSALQRDHNLSLFASAEAQIWISAKLLRRKKYWGHSLGWQLHKASTPHVSRVSGVPGTCHVCLMLSYLCLCQSFTEFSRPSESDISSVKFYWNSTEPTEPVKDHNRQPQYTV